MAGNVETSGTEATYGPTSFWADFNDVFGVETTDMFFKQDHKLSVNNELVQKRYEQRIRGVRVKAGNVNVRTGAHGGVLSADGHPIKTTDVAGISEVPSVRADEALARAMDHVQEKFGAVYALDIKASEPVWHRPTLLKEASGEGKLAYEFTTTATIDGELFATCFNVEGGWGNEHYHPSTHDKAIMDRFGVAYAKTEEEKVALRRECNKQILRNMKPMSHIRSEMASQGVTHDSHVKKVNLAPHKWTNKVLPAAYSTRRLTIYVDAHSGEVLNFEDKDTNKVVDMNGNRVQNKVGRAAQKKQQKAQEVAALKASGKNLRANSQSAARNFWGASLQAVQPAKANNNEANKRVSTRATGTVDFVDFHVIVYDCMNAANCDPDEYTTVLFDSATDSYPTSDDEINLVVQSTYDTKVMYEIISSGDWKSFMKEVPDWVIYLHLDDLNAFWDGERIVIGTGMVDDDVVAHEWSHAYTEYTSGLAYYYQSGAINEHMSDAFGEAVDQLNTAAGVPDDGATDTDTGSNLDGMLARSDDLACNVAYNALETTTATDDAVVIAQTDAGVKWMLGEGLTRLYGGVHVASLRDMWYPWCFSDPLATPDPERSDEMFMSCGDQDNGGVHTNSNILNYLYSHLVDGGNVSTVPETMFSNDPAPEVYIEGWGIEKAVPFWWQLQIALFEREATNFEDFSNMAYDLCENLVGLDMPAASVDPDSTAYVQLNSTNCDGLLNMINVTRIHQDLTTYCIADVRPQSTEYDAPNLCTWKASADIQIPGAIDMATDNWSLAGFNCTDAGLPYVDPCVHPGSWSGIPECFDYDGNNNFQAGSLVKYFRLNDAGYNSALPTTYSTLDQGRFFWGNFIWSSFYFVFVDANVTGTLQNDIYDVRSGQFIAQGNPLLTGAIPNQPEFSATTMSGTANKASYMDLSRNSLTSLPTASFQPLMADVDFSDNLLTGNVPAALGASSGVTQLNLDDNSLTGSLSDLMSMPSLQLLSVANNDFDSLLATLPASLQAINLAGNVQITSIPTDWYSHTWDESIIGVCALDITGTGITSFDGSLCNKITNGQFYFNDGMVCTGKAGNCANCGPSVEGNAVAVQNDDDGGASDDDGGASDDDGSDDISSDCVNTCLAKGKTIGWTVSSCGTFGTESEEHTCESKGTVYCCASSEDECCDVDDGAIAGLVVGIVILIGGMSLVAAIFCCGVKLPCMKQIPRANRDAPSNSRSAAGAANPMREAEMS